MAIVQHCGYKTSDGKFFDRVEDAKKHQKELDDEQIKNAFIRSTFKKLLLSTSKYARIQIAPTSYFKTHEYELSTVTDDTLDEYLIQLKIRHERSTRGYWPSDHEYIPSGHIALYGRIIMYYNYQEEIKTLIKSGLIGITIDNL